MILEGVAWTFIASMFGVSVTFLFKAWRLWRLERQNDPD